MHYSKKRKKNNPFIFRLIWIGLIIFCFGSILRSQPSPEKDLQRFFQSLSEVTKPNLDSARYYFDAVIKSAEENKDVKRKLEMIRQKGYFFEVYNQLDYAVEVYQEGISFAQRNVDIPFQITLFTDLAITCRKMGAYKESKKFHNAALILADEIGDLQGKENNLHGLGYLYETTNEYEQAVSYYHRSLEVAEQRGEQSGIVTTLQNIGMTYSKIGNFTLAKETIESAFELSIDVGDSLVITNVLHDFGTILLQMGDYDGALEKFLKSLEINRMEMAKATIARSLMFIAEVYTKKNELDEARKYFEECLVYKEFMKDEDLAELYHKIGLLNYDQNGLQEAAEAFLNSLELSELYNYTNLIQRNNFSLYKVFAKEGKNERALFHLEQSSILKDSIFNVEQTARLAELRFLYDTEKSEKQILELTAQQGKFLLIGSTSLFGILFLFMAYLIRLKNKNNQTLKQKNEEIQKQNVKLRESNEVMKQFTYVTAHDLKEPLRNIGSFISLFQRKYGTQFNKEANDYMKFVNKGVHRLNDLLNALVEYSSISIQKPTNEKIDLREIVKDISFNLREDIESKNAQILLAEDLPELQMNELHVTQLFQNLISNSLKFAENAPIIWIEAIQKSEEIVYCVQDNGIGIQTEYKDKVYKLFHQLDRNTEGQGIGLTICKNIVDKYNGKIWFEANRERGARFFISFPKMQAA